jgi:hypothetical protein
MKRLVVIFSSLILFACNPYMTKKISLVLKENMNDSVFVVDPIIETRLQISPNSHKSDTATFLLAKKLSREVIHQLLDKRLRLKYAQEDSLNSVMFETLMDSINDKFLETEYSHFILNKRIEIPSSANLILIPYLKWTRTTPYYEWDKCSPQGKIYAGDRICTWSRARAYLFVIDRKRGEIIYFKCNQWIKSEIWMPYENRILRSFKRCVKPLLRKLN